VTNGLVAWHKIQDA